MRRRLSVAAGLAALIVTAPASGQQEVAADGYAFDKPRLLTQQLTWGLAHGVELLATACREAEGTGREVADAYAAWRSRYRERIDRAGRELSQHYFAIDGASPERLDAALHLKPQLDQRPDEIAAACASFAHAMATPRYDLDMFYELRRDAARVERAEAVRQRVADCARKLAGDAAAVLETRFAAWTQANELIENVARSRLLSLKGDRAEDRQWRRDAGAGAVPPATACDQLADRLVEPGYALRDVFGDGDR